MLYSADIYEIETKEVLTPKHKRESYSTPNPVILDKWKDKMEMLVIALITLQKQQLSMDITGISIP